jgi:putative transposase
LQEHIADGWRPVALEEHHLVDLFRPHVRCKVTREAISPVGNGQRYYHPELGAWNGKEVMAAIDPMEWRAVWVKTLQGEFLFVADLVKATGYRAKSQYEIAEGKRAEAQVKRLSQKVEAIHARTGTALAAPASSQIVLGGRVIDADSLEHFAPQTEAADVPTNEEPRQIEQKPEHRSRSDRTPAENYADWRALDARLQAGELLDEADARWHRMYPASAQYRAEAQKEKAAA